MQARVNDVTINYELEGPAWAPVVTLSHSLAAHLGLWDSQVRVLKDSYRVLRFDTRGHGRSSAPPGPYSMEMLAGDVISLLVQLGIERTHFVGISMGGMIGQVLAVRYAHRLESLILCDTTSRVPPEARPLWEERIRIAEKQGMAHLAQPTLERWLSQQYRQTYSDVAEHIGNMIAGTPLPGYAGCCRAISGFDISGELEKVTTPTLIMVGENDRNTPVSDSEAIRRQIRGSQLIVLPGAMHLSNVEASTAFNQALLRFLGQTAGRRGK